MRDVLAWSFDAIRWPETISAFAAVVTAIIAFCALQTWKHQDKAKGKAQFLDALIEAAHTYIAEMPKPITLLEIAKSGMQEYAPTWESAKSADIGLQGAIAYIQKNGERNAKRLLEVVGSIQPSVVKLRSLVAKGQVFKFDDYAKCQNAVSILTWHFDRIEAFMAIIGSPSWNWEHPDVLRHLKDALTIEPDDIRKSIHENNITLLEFSSESYKQIYG